MLYLVTAGQYSAYRLLCLVEGAPGRAEVIQQILDDLGDKARQFREVVDGVECLLHRDYAHLSDEELCEKRVSLMAPVMALAPENLFSNVLRQRLTSAGFEVKTYQEVYTAENPR